MSHGQIDIEEESFSYETCPIESDHEIRVLKIHPAPSRDAPIECTIETWNKSEQYDALSYCWGLEAKSEPVYVQTKQGLRYITVTPSLFSVLLAFRQPSNARLMWIDQICIDQYDLGEKEAQIRMMSDIFNRASLVRVWLGDDKSSAKGFKLINSITERCRALDSLTHEPSMLDSWTSLYELSHKPWFRRRWVLQEIAVARKATLHSGPNEADWTDFVTAVSLLRNNQDLLEKVSAKSAASQSITKKQTPALSLIDAIEHLFHKSDHGQIVQKLLPLEDVVVNFMPFQSIFFHDAVYSALSVAAMGGVVKTLRPRRDFYRIDYTLSFTEFAADFVTYVARNSGRLDIILRPWYAVSPEANSNLPSWICSAPQDNVISTVLHSEVLLGSSGNIYAAAGYTQPLFTFKNSIVRNSKAPGRIQVKGFLLDTISASYDLVLSKENTPQQVPNEWATICGWTDHSLPPPGSFWRILVADRGMKGVRTPAYFRLACHASSRLSSTNIINMAELLETKSTPTVVRQYIERAQSVLGGRKLIRTRRSFMGLGPQGCEEGDIICILYGCSVPVVLRSCVTKGSKEPSFYRIIGGAYVHEMMQGEALQWKKSNPQVHTDAFELC